MYKNHFTLTCGFVKSLETARDLFFSPRTKLKRHLGQVGPQKMVPFYFSKTVKLSGSYCSGLSATYVLPGRLKHLPELSCEESTTTSV